MPQVDIPLNDIELMAHCYAAKSGDYQTSYFNYIEGMKDAVRYLNAVKFDVSMEAEHDDEVRAIIVK